ncbi:MAG: hypothetical protein H8E31_03640 [Planctomycetes bacterium]|nr:hypothetical protein [Planctomycetota bacterium]
MAGLILSLFLAALAGDPQPRLEARRARVLAQVDRMLAAPRAESEAWRGRLFHWVRRLDHALDPRVQAGWQLLADRGGSTDLANLVLYQRRHQLPLSFDGTALAPADPMLEFALSLWGEGRLEETAAFLRRSIDAHPDDSRLSDNLRWLEGRPAPVLSLRADSREISLTILALRARSGR